MSSLFAITTRPKCYGSWETTCEWQSHSFASNKYLSQSNISNVTNNRNELLNNCMANEFFFKINQSIKKCNLAFQSSPRLSNFYVSLSLVAVPTARVLINSRHSSLKVLNLFIEFWAEAWRDFKIQISVLTWGSYGRVKYASRERDENPGSKHCLLNWKTFGKRAIWRIFKI